MRYVDGNVSNQELKAQGWKVMASAPLTGKVVRLYDINDILFGYAFWDGTIWQACTKQGESLGYPWGGMPTYWREV